MCRYTHKHTCACSAGYQWSCFTQTCRVGLIVSAVVCAAPLTIPSALPGRTTECLQLFVHVLCFSLALSFSLSHTLTHSLSVIHIHTCAHTNVRTHAWYTDTDTLWTRSKHARTLLMCCEKDSGVWMFIVSDLKLCAEEITPACAQASTHACTHTKHVLSFCTRYHYDFNLWVLMLAIWLSKDIVVHRSDVISTAIKLRFLSWCQSCPTHQAAVNQMTWPWSREQVRCLHLIDLESKWGACTWLIAKASEVPAFESRSLQSRWAVISVSETWCEFFRN